GDIEWFPGFIVDQQVTISVLPTDRRGRGIEMESRRFPVANEFRSGIFEIDSKTIILPLSSLQQMLKMDKAVRVRMNPDEDAFAGFDEGDEASDERGDGGGGAQVVGVEPARVTTVLVKAEAGIEPEVLRDRCVAIYREFAQA